MVFCILPGQTVPPEEQIIANHLQIYKNTSALQETDSSKNHLCETGKHRPGKSKRKRKTKRYWGRSRGE